MSQLIQLRQRLKAIETIKKITSAMRIISRSLHTRMNKQKKDALEYRERLRSLLEKLSSCKKEWSPEHFFPKRRKVQKNLYVIVGAQKGLCGNYNTEIQYWLNKHKQELTQSAITLMTIGKRTRDLVKEYGLEAAYQLEELKNSSLDSLTENILTHIMQTQKHYTKVFLISSVPESFFIHRLEILTLIPLSEKYSTEKGEQEDYLWHHSHELVLDKLATMYLRATIYNTLFLSLLGEQAARFIAMDNATRNANNFTDAMQLQYNKMRQAKITRELTELSASFQS